MRHRALVYALEPVEVVGLAVACVGCASCGGAVARRARYYVAAVRDVSRETGVHGGAARGNTGVGDGLDGSDAARAPAPFCLMRSAQVK